MNAENFSVLFKESKIGVHYPLINDGDNVAFKSGFDGTESCIYSNPEK